MIKVQLPTREHRLHELNLNYGDVVFFIGQNGLKPNPIHKFPPVLNGEFIELPPALAGGQQ